MRTTVDSILSTSDSSSSSSTVSSHQPRTMAIRTALKQDILGTSWSGGVGISNAGGESGTPTNGSVSNSATGAIVSLTSSLQDANTSSDNLSSIASSDLKEFPLADVKDILDDPVASTPIIALAAEVSHINEDENNITASIQSFSNCNDIIKPVAGQFSVLPAHVCLFLLKNFITHLPTAYSLSKTCKFWYTLFIDDSIFRQAAATRFHLDTAELQIRLLHESLETSWRDVYQRLDEGRTSWKGFAIDRATNNFLPYPMEIIIGKTKRVLDKRNKQQHILKTDFDGMCRWESLRNSLTKVTKQFQKKKNKSRNVYLFLHLFQRF